MKWQISFGCIFGVSINNRCKQSIMKKYTEKSHVDKIIEESLRWWNKSRGFSFLEKWANRGEAWFTMPVFSWMHLLNCKWIILLPTYFPPWNSLIVRLAEMYEAHCLLRVKENSNSSHSSSSALFELWQYLEQGDTCQDFKNAVLLLLHTSVK